MHVCVPIHPSILLPPPSCLCLLFCRTDRRIHDKNGEITGLQERVTELEELLQQEKKEVVDLREGLRLRQESLDVQQRQRQQVGSEGMCGWEMVRGVCEVKWRT